MTTPRVHGPDEEGRVRLSGDWVLAHAAELVRQVEDFARSRTHVRSWSLVDLGRLDTLGASVLLDLVGVEEPFDALVEIPTRHRRLLEVVAHADAEPIAPPAPRMLLGYVAEIGDAVGRVWAGSVQLLGFLGLLLLSLPPILVNPRRWRMTSLVVQIQQTGVNAVPIIALLTFLVGAVVAFLGATILRDFGATLYTIDLIALSFMREFGVLLAAIMVAGRSGSAFTAQLGSMRAHEEIDAIQALGMSPIEVLVVPRVLALVVSLPLLTVLSIASGIFGGAMVCVLALDMSPAMYLARVQDVLELRHFWVGLGKAPLFAVMIALIGCLEGFKVSGSAESVGRHTTSSVVQSIFVVILIDALAAVFFMEMGW